MPYRWPVYVGDRVALAPHTDLWKRGIKFAKVVDRVYSQNQPVRKGAPLRVAYVIAVGEGDAVTEHTLEDTDLLGSVPDTRHNRPT